MYEERERFSIKDVVLQVVLVVLFVFLLLWLFPTKSYVDNKIDSKLEPFYNQIFTTNINNMKEAAISYFTTPRLPKNIGDKEKLTLSEMLDKKLLVPFLDSKNKKCDLTDSYVEITKMDDEYILKVNLSCSDNSDYILVHLGCYNYCQSGLCEKQETTTSTTTKPSKPSVTPMVNKSYEYEYEKIINGKWGDWSEWSEWSTSKVDRTEYRNVKTKQETVVVGEETVKVGTKTVITAAASKTTHYCPSGYTQNGTSCTRSYTTTDTIDATLNYSCPSGYTQNGTICTKVNTSTSVETISATLNYSCPSGYTQNGNTCEKQESYIKYYARGSYLKTVTNAYSVPKSTSSRYYEMTGSDYVYDCNNSCAMRWVYTYKVYTTTPVYGSKTVTASLVSSYSCPSGYTRNGSTCSRNVTNSSTDTKNASSSYSCPNGYTLNGNKCSKQVTNTQTIKASSKTTYSCTKGDLVGRSCVTYEDKYETFNIYATKTYYSYQTREYISGERKVVWSRSQSDQTLIKDGYSLTGNYREI